MSIPGFLNDWRALIVAAYSNHPFSAAILTLAAIGSFIQLETQWRRRRMPTNLAIVLAGWSVDRLS